MHMQEAVARGSQIFVSAVAVFELCYGVAKSARQEFNQERLSVFLAGPVTLLPLADQDARIAGSVRASLEASGKPIGAYDVLMAGQALCHQLTLVTANASEFSRVKGLLWKDWAKS
jgi:tRNA(fMet)-specific endonuclease VapC